MATTIETSGSPAAKPSAIPRSAYYALALLGSANFLNYLDRSIISIIAEAIKADLKLDDADLGFLMGTAFAVFYAVVGIAMGRISDGLSRKKVMAFGLALWSGMTALGGAATSFLMLAIARIGVGVGEAAANPCSHSLLADMFPRERRGIAMSVYLVGTFAGMAGSMVIGGTILQHWQTSLCTAIPLAGACGLAGWKAALFAVGLPGLPLALLLLTIREPARNDARDAPAFTFVIREFATAIPPFTFASIYAIGGSSALARNIRLAAAIVAVCLLLIWGTGDIAQWLACAIGLYSVMTWGQVQAMRDKPLFSLTFGDPTFLLAMSASALISCASAAVGVWTAPYAMRSFAMSPSEVGLSLGLIGAVGSILGVLLGGLLADRWKARDLRAPLWIMAISAAFNLPGIILLLSMDSARGFLIVKFCLTVVGSMWGGSTAAMIQDLVISRMRGSAAACFSLVSIVVASGMGPYWAGKISVWSGSLTAGLLSMLVLLPIALVIIWFASKRMIHETAEARLARAVAAGEPSPEDTAA